MIDLKKVSKKITDFKIKKTKQNKEESEKEEKSTNQKTGEHSKFTEVGTRILDQENNEDTLVMQKESAKDSPASLVLLNGPKDLIGHSWPLISPIISVGRSKRLNDIFINYDSLSKSHFQIIKEKGSLYIVDLRSTNKTYINDVPLEPYQKKLLENNVYIRASSLIFKFLDKGSIEFFSSMQMLSKSQTDPLTGAGNRQLLKIKGSEYFFSKQPLSLIVFDIDNFKSVNDNLGHMAGDYVLKTLSNHILETIRDGDLFIRYGGDEFCILTPQILSGAQKAAERIRNKIKETKFIFKNQNINVNISIGVSEKSSTDKAWEDIYHRADAISYKEKKKKKYDHKKSLGKESCH